MSAGYIKFDSIPEIGFAHHHYSNDYVYDYQKSKNSLEIVYVNSGTIILEFGEKAFYVHQGDILVLFRHLPIKLYSRGDGEQSHCTVQLQFDFTFELVEQNKHFPDDGLLLPFVTGRSELTHGIKKELYEIVHRISVSPDRSSFHSALKAVEIMHKLDTAARNTCKNTDFSHYDVANLAESYVADNIRKKIYLKDIAEALGKSPNYINYAFKKTKGLTLTEYINEEKVKAVISLMRTQNMHFSTACNCMGIPDSSYGYRLFKKHTGLTPKMFLKSEKILRR